MKRIILLVLILVVTPFLVESEKTLNQLVEEIGISNSKNPETANWEYVKDRVFDGETSVFRKLEGPILIELMDASKTDSLLVSEIILDIREILPHKEIDFFNDFIGMSFSEMVIKGFKANDSIRNFTFEKIADSRIHIRFEPSNLYRNSNNDFIQLGQGYSIQSHSAKRIDDKIIRQPFMTVSIGDVYSYDEKKKYLTAGLLRQLVFLQNDSDVNGRSVFWKKEITGMDHFILDRDIFLLKKLYSDDFLTQFEDYLYAHYPIKEMAAEKEAKKMTSITVKKGEKLFFVKLEEVIYFEADAKYVSFYTNSGNHLTEQSLAQLEEKLPDYFLRVHRSIIINTNYVENAQKYFNSR
ncbi:LytTr DNA-binding domain-containing protein [Arenibacter nanhaiticus]|uniref:LytTr DNA-binding domain-containing protein n=1 Tax=Arenibacter nanhaiticus TaxID=558155 RepID=A0A1M6LS41_9FLAO|nr:LytTR family DNA-binding domain-containing protein [Arenibacter nanhaiticus]SHJ73955.1 LytTr DNA-binding domain-containing protein [Arenibacter nanhaiticus]